MSPDRSPSPTCMRDPPDRSEALQATFPPSVAGLNQRESGNEAVGSRDQPKQARADEQGQERGHDGDGRQHDRQLKPAARDLQPVVTVPLVVAILRLAARLLK